MTYNKEKIEELIQNIPPFKQHQDNKNIKDYITDYINHIMRKDDLDVSEKLKNAINDICESLFQAEKLFLTGSISECYNTINDLLFRNNHLSNISINIPTGSCYYRMRSSDNGYLFSKEEMFHIPFNNRRKIQNQRFSLSGYPCLYLGSSTYICWEELNRPKIETANISLLKTKRELTLLDLRMPKVINSINDLYRIPIILACSIKVKEPNSPFKPEYIISQSILHAIINENKNKDRNKNNIHYDGIIYYSTHYNDKQNLFTDINLFENIVIPTSNNKNNNAEEIYQDGYCPVLCNNFSISDATSITINNMTKDRLTVFFSTNPKEGEEYIRSNWNEIERSLQRKQQYDISPCKFFKLHTDLLKNY